MKLDSHFINEELIHILLFTSYNLVIQDLDKKEKFAHLFSLIEGYHVEEIDLGIFEDNDALKLFLDGTEKQYGKSIFIFHNLRSEFFPEIFPSSHRFVLMMDSDPSTKECLSNYSGNKFLLYSSKTKKFTPEFNSPNLEYPKYILNQIKEKGFTEAKQQVRNLFDFVEGFT